MWGFRTDPVVVQNVDVSEHECGGCIGFAGLHRIFADGGAYWSGRLGEWGQGPWGRSPLVNFTLPQLKSV